MVLVTGAARGIGAATARLATESGHAVALLDRDAERVEAEAGKLCRSGGTAVAIACDVNNEAEVEAAFADAADRLGSLDGVVAAAGIDRGGRLHQLPAAAWDEVIGVNLRGTFLTCRAALRHMLGRGGAIVCISSTFALVSPPGGASAYGASKAGILALVRSLAVDYARDGVRVNAVLPGPTDTDLMWANVPGDEVSEVRRTIEREVPLGRLAEPEEPALAALWLLSAQASFVTGAQLACDGGVLARASVSA